MNWTPLHLHSHYSLLDGLSKPRQIASRCQELGFTSCALTDHGTISGAVSFSKSCRSKNIKPILGCEFYLSQDAKIKSPENRTLSHLCVLSKNKKGWHKLIEAVSRSNDEDLFYYKPRIDLQTLGEYADGNLIAFSGHLGSDMANAIFTDYKSAYNQDTEEEVKKFIDPNWVENVTKTAYTYMDVFGKDNFLIEVQCIDQDNSPAAMLVAKGMRYIAKKLKIPTVATADSHYPTKQDSGDHMLLLCSSMKTTLRKIRNKK